MVSVDFTDATGLDYAVNRIYSSEQARFLQPDPIGMASVDLTDPQTLNLYTYAGNNPIDFTDPTGLYGGAIISNCRIKCWETSVEILDDGDGSGALFSNVGSSSGCSMTCSVSWVLVQPISPPSERGGGYGGGGLGPQDKQDKKSSQEGRCGVNPITNKPGINVVDSGKPGEIRPGDGGKGFFDSKRKRRGGKRDKHRALDISGQLKKPDTRVLVLIRRSGRKNYSVRVVKGAPASAVHASLGGTVSLARVVGGYGQRVVIDHGGGYQTAYAHLSETYVKKGDVVAQGKIIGRVGQTGNAKGQAASEAHVHFEVRRDGTPQRPGKFLNARCPKALRK